MILARNERIRNRKAWSLSLVLLVGLCCLGACSSPQPSAPTTWPDLSPTPETPASRMTLTPVDAPGTPPPATAIPVTGPPFVLAEVRVEIEYNPWLYMRPLAVDPEAGRLYVSGMPGQTLVFSINPNSSEPIALPDQTLETGGNLAMDDVNGRLYVGDHTGLSVHSQTSGMRLTHLELVRLSASEASTLLPAIPLIAPSSRDVYVIQNGLYVVSAAGLTVSRLTDESRDVRAIGLDEKRAVLYASINNGVSGSNNRDDLWSLDLKTRQFELLSPGVVDFAVDAGRGRLIAALDMRMSAPASLGALQVWAGRPFSPTQTLWNLGGQLALDSARDRLYVLSGGQPARLAALQASTLALEADLALPGPYIAMTLDAVTDRLYLLSDDGHLLVVSAHGRASPHIQPFQPYDTPDTPVARLAISPDFAHDQTLLGVWGHDPRRDGVALMSQDGGVSWGRLGDGLPELSPVADLAFSPAYAQDRTMFAAMQRGLYRSSDGGQTWQPASAGLRDMWSVQVLVSPAYADHPLLYALTFSEGLHRSTDGGQAWVSLAGRYGDQRDPTSQDAYSLALSPAFGTEPVAWLGAGRANARLWVSDDAGDAWRPLVSATLRSLYPSPAFERDSLLLGVFDQQGLMRSDDGGQTWRGALSGVQGASGQDSLALSPDFERDRTVLLLTHNPRQLYRSLDGGSTWQISAAPLAAQVTSLAFDPQAVGDAVAVWLGTSRGQVMRADLSDMAWTSLEAATRPAQWEAVALSPAFAQDRTLFVASKDAGVWASADGGLNWRDTGFPGRELGIGRMHLVVSPDFERDRSLFVATGSQLYRSPDAGQTWQALPLAPGGLFPINSLALSPNYGQDRTLVVAGDYRQPIVRFSSDGGQTWQSSAITLPQASNLNLLTFAPGGGVYLWAESDGLYRSDDGGRTWMRVYKPSGAWLVQSFAISPDFRQDRLMWLGIVKETHSVYRSPDGGGSWHPAELGLPLELLWTGALTVSPDFGRDRVIWLGTDKGIYRSSDGGQSWRALTSLSQVVALAVSPGVDGEYTLFAISTSDGLYASSDSGRTWQPLGR